MDRKYSRELKEVLSKPTLLVYARMHAAYEFDNDFSAPFAKKELVEYLQLSPEQLAEVRSVAAKERVSWLRKKTELNDETFHKLTELLSPNARQKIESVFRDVWKVDVWN